MKRETAPGEQWEPRRSLKQEIKGVRFESGLQPAGSSDGQVETSSGAHSFIQQGLNQASGPVLLRGSR